MVLITKNSERQYEVAATTIELKLACNVKVDVIVVDALTACRTLAHKFDGSTEPFKIDLLIGAEYYYQTIQP